MEKVQGLPQSSFSLWFSSPSLSHCAAWVIPFQQHPCPPGRGMEPSNTTQTKTLGVPCAGPWAETRQTPSLSPPPCSPLSIHRVFFTLSLSFTHTWTQNPHREPAEHNRRSSSCFHFSHENRWQFQPFSLAQVVWVLHYFTLHRHGAGCTCRLSNCNV